MATRRLAGVLALALSLAAGPPPRPARAAIFYGDLHAHSGLSNDATGAPDLFFVTARDLAGLDFVVLSDHDIFLQEGEWEILKATAASFDDPGRFVAFSAVEWTQALSYHLNVYFRAEGGEYCRGFACPRAEDFYGYYGERVLAGEAAAHVNHAASASFRVPWDRIDDAITTSVEVWNSASGEEADQEHLFNGAQWALRAGFRLGLVGVSDDHHTDEPPPLLGTGLTGCHADRLERGALVDALRARRCFATDGARIRLDTEIGGTAMGGERRAAIGERLAVRVEVVATATPVSVELVAGGRVVARRYCRTPVCDLATAIRVEDPDTFVYPRVVQADGHRAWGSPVWVRGDCPGGGDCLRGRLAGATAGRPESCLAQWLLPRGRAPLRTADGATRLACRDGDRACDAGEEPGACTFELGLCFGQPGPGGSPCPAAGIERWTVEAPQLLPIDVADPVDRENHLTLAAALHAGTLATAGRTCSPAWRLRVPVGERRFSITAGAGAFADADELVLACAPGRVGGAPVRPGALPQLRAR